MRHFSLLATGVTIVFKTEDGSDIKTLVRSLHVKSKLFESIVTNRISLIFKNIIVNT